MGRTAATVRRARHVIALRHAARHSVEVKDELDGVIEDLRDDIDDTMSKTQAAEVIGISVPTLDKWIDRGFIPVQVAKSGRPRVPRDHVLALAEQVDELRRMGERRHLIAVVVDRMQREDKSYQSEFRKLYGPSLAAMAEGDFVTAAPSDDFGSGD